ncbi:tripartite tricarboxylate transporter TctB family protein [Pacificibacter maritimus]|uniref:Tripartite tricarboxylate transporter TctB family protein n=2 Tax=Pacificibacter maritimus TaxID=762213 RepID=A0A3N4U3R1_9RHOB|nr:tripartite tricarboxylate transporter TctB family protein [Pacificibacter maritimus]
MKTGKKFARLEPMFGSLALIVAACFVLGIGWGYSAGKLTQMGPGYFPRIVGFALLGFGALSLYSDVTNPTVSNTRFEWRNLAFVCASILTFAALIDRAGLVPATFVSVALATIADSQNSVKSTLIYTLCVCLFAWGLFIHVLELPLSAFGRG